MVKEGSQGGTLNKDPNLGTGSRKRFSGAGIPSLADGPVSGDKATEKRQNMISGSTDVGRAYRKKIDHSKETQPVSRKLLYGGICAGSLALGVVRRLSNNNVLGLESMISLGVPIIGALFGFMHEAGLQGGFTWPDFYPAQGYGAVVGGTGALVCERAGYLATDYLLQAFS